MYIDMKLPLFLYAKIQICLGCSRQKNSGREDLQDTSNVLLLLLLLQVTPQRDFNGQIFLERGYIF